MVSRLDLLHIQWVMNDILTRSAEEFGGDSESNERMIVLMNALRPILDYFDKYEIREKGPRDAN